MSLKNKILTNSKNKNINILAHSSVFDERDVIPIDIPMLNVALLGDFDGGMPPGILMIAGMPKTFKTGYTLLLMKAFQQKHKNGIIAFFDSEFGAPMEYFESNGIDSEQIVHIPVSTLEELKTEAYNIIIEYDEKKDEPLLIVVDSIGNLPSAKEARDAKDAKETADFTKAKENRSFFRLMRVPANLKGVPIVVINQVYQTMDQYSPDEISGGKGSVYNSDFIWQVGKRKEREGKELMGHWFDITIRNSRYVKEGSKIPILVTYESQVYKWSGLYELAVECGILQQSGAWISVKGQDKKIQRKDLTDDFYENLLKDEEFRKFVKKKYKLSTERDIIVESVISETEAEVEQ